MHHATSSNANKVFNAHVICIKMLQGNYAGPRLQRHYNLSTVERIQERLIYYYLLQHVGFSLCQHTEHLLDPSITIHEILSFRCEIYINDGPSSDQFLCREAGQGGW